MLLTLSQLADNVCIIKKRNVKEKVSFPHDLFFEFNEVPL